MVKVESQPTTEELTLRTLEKGLRILEEVAASGRQGMPVAVLGRRLGLHRTTLHRFLTTLIRCGYIEQIDGRDDYRLGLKTLELTAAMISGLSLRDVGSPILEELRRLTQETVHSVILDHGEVVTIDRLEGDQLIALRTQIGNRRPAHCTATGKAMLAFLPEETVDEILGRGMPALTPKTITDPLSFKAQLQEVRVRGYATDDEELAVGIRCVAAPVFDFTGRVIGALSIAAPSLRVGQARLHELSIFLSAAAHRLSRQLGYRVGPPLS